MTQYKRPETWQELQEAVAQVLADDEYVVQVEEILPTARSSVSFDVFAEKAVGGHKLTIAVECKHWRASVPQAVVHAFRAQVDDLGAGAGYIVSSGGFQRGAYDAARNTSIRLVTWDEFLEQFAPEGPPLGPGLKASAQIVGGSIGFIGREGSVLPWANSIVTGGSVKRDSNGGLVVAIKTEAALPGIQEANAKIGWEGFELTAATNGISCDSTTPTVLSGMTEFTTAPGMRGLHPESGAMMTFPVPIHAKLVIQADGYLQGQNFTGTWIVTAHTSLFLHAIPLRGTFSVRLL